MYSRWYVLLEMDFTSHLTYQVSSSSRDCFDKSIIAKQINDSIYLSRRWYYWSRKQEQLPTLGHSLIILITSSTTHHLWGVKPISLIGILDFVPNWFWLSLSTAIDGNIEMHTHDMYMHYNRQKLQMSARVYNNLSSPSQTF